MARARLPPPIRAIRTAGGLPTSHPSAQDRRWLPERSGPSMGHFPPERSGPSMAHRLPPERSGPSMAHRLPPERSG
eukprot:4788034-Pyramimonas_sp.AAC.1